MENIEKFESDVTGLFAKVKEVIALIHNLVGGIMSVFEKECAFCGDIH